MEAYRGEATIGLGGKLHLDHLPFRAGKRVEVAIRIPKASEGEWPEGYFAATFGAISDDSIVRHPQCEIG